MLKYIFVACSITVAAGHGALVSPAPRSAHSQSWDDANKCGSSNPYSTTGLRNGEYCGLGCLGDACLYYQIGCFQGCRTCSLQGKTLYPVQGDLDKAKCGPIPEPTLGGGNATQERELRTYNVNGESHMGDWTKWMPWRSPGSAGKGNPEFQPCGINSGALASQPEPPTTAHDVPNGGNGTDLPKRPRSEWAVWKAGSVAEAEWSIYANHGGGYSYRLCKSVEGEVATEECYQQTPLDFATAETEIRYYDGRDSINIVSPTTSDGTWPVGSQWRKNPVPMCNCDMGASCSAKESWTTKAHSLRGLVAVSSGGKTCTADSTCTAAKSSGCQVCAEDTTLPWSCSKCCNGCKEVKKIGGMYCDCSSPSPAGPTRNTPYPTTNLRPGQTSSNCPTGFQFPTLWDDGAGPSYSRLGTFPFTMVDKLRVPNVPAGEYSVSWRWDCEETPQVWNSCADIIITA